MRLEQLMQIVEIDYQRSLSQAAKRLFISQPSLSISVNNLEEELGFKIFHRSNTGVTPTDLGQEVLRLARNVISEIEQMKDLKTGNANIRGNVHFAITPVMANSLGAGIDPAFSPAVPQCSAFDRGAKYAHDPGYAGQRHLQYRLQRLQRTPSSVNAAYGQPPRHRL